MILETFPVGPLQCNCTILGDEETREAIVIDPGDEVSRIHRRLSALNFTLKQILITHAHIDHIGGALKLKSLTGAPIFLNEDDLPQLKIMAEQAAWLGVATPETAPPDEALTDGRNVGLANYPAQVLHTPGHTRAPSACTSLRSRWSSLATPFLPAASAAPTCPAATTTRSRLHPRPPAYLAR